MSNIYFTVTGLHHYYGDSFLEKEMIVYLKKEKDRLNRYIGDLLIYSTLIMSI